MTLQALREFINQSFPAATGLCALSAALDAKVSGAPLDPALAARIQDVLAALGAPGVLDGVSATEAAPLLAEIRHLIQVDAKLLYPHTRATSWSYDDEQLLREVGEFARFHAVGLARNVVPALEGLADRFRSPGSAFLDIGVGVAGLAIGFAELFPSARVVGIDVWQPALRRARQNVERAGMQDRIELREQGAESLEDDRAFDLAWLPTIFMAERLIPTAMDRVHRALRPGGWGVCAFANLSASDEKTAALWRLRTTMFGGPLWTPAHVEKLLRERGYADARVLPVPPGSPMALVAGRRAQGS
jgi:ubiquinone/menaquinone biosynthesis C-methylase UbiE